MKVLSYWSYDHCESAQRKCPHISTNLHTSKLFVTNYAQSTVVLLRGVASRWVGVVIVLLGGGRLANMNMGVARWLSVWL